MTGECPDDPLTLRIPETTKTLTNTRGLIVVLMNVYPFLKAKTWLKVGVATSQTVREILGFDSEKSSFSLIRKIKRAEFEPDIKLKLLNELNSSFNTFGSNLLSLIRAYSNK